MSLQFNTVALLLVVLILLGVLSNNSSVTISAAILLLMQQTFLAKYIPFMEKHGITLGIIILTIGVLSPIVSGKIQLPHLAVFLNWKMWLAVAVGLLVAWLGGRGVGLMGRTTCIINWIIGRDHSWCCFCWRYSSWTVNRRGDLIFILRKILKLLLRGQDEK